MWTKYIGIILIGAGVTACSFGLHKTVSTKLIPVKKTELRVNAVDSLVYPFSQNLSEEMNEKLAVANVGFINERPNGNLGNLVSDVLRQAMNEKYGKNALCLLNFGGLRSTLNKGDITVGDVFKLLPFDNYVAIVRFKGTSMASIRTWIEKSNGHPISGFKIDKTEVTLEDGTSFDAEKDFWLITSDYLLNGGDNATFFNEKLEVIQTTILLRDIFTESIRGKVLEDNQEKRIILN